LTFETLQFTHALDLFLLKKESNPILFVK